jgi:hypothetical protein
MLSVTHPCHASEVPLCGFGEVSYTLGAPFSVTGWYENFSEIETASVGSSFPHMVTIYAIEEQLTHEGLWAHAA